MRNLQDGFIVPQQEFQLPTAHYFKSITDEALAKVGVNSHEFPETIIVYS